MTTVKVAQGLLEGEVLDLVTGNGKYYSFKGIPYAEPPVGKLRFKDPRPPKPWEGVKKAKAHGPVCPQLDIFTNTIIKSNEDCLYLNVYTQDLKPKSPLPVMVFIHGGGYKSGSGNDKDYGPDFLVNHGVILVTINYRLDALGFLCLDTEDVPGNAAMKDQVAALRWVRENISNFGGDPSNITVIGESAGGACTLYHLISPMSKGLFQKVISMSGSPSCDWSVAFRPRERAFTLGKLLGIETEDPKELLEFLQKVPTEKLVTQHPTLTSNEETTKNNIMKMFHFTPVVEKDFGQECFITELPYEALAHNRLNNVDLFIGYTSEEGLVGLQLIVDDLISKYNRFPEHFVPRELQVKLPPDTILDVAAKIRKHYFNNKPINNDIIKEFVKYASDSYFVYDILRFMQRLPKTGSNKRYMYKFSCLSERNVFGNPAAKYGIHKTSHLDDLMYLFDPKGLDLKVNKKSKEFELIQLVTTVFTNFAKYGTPTPDSSLGLTWPEYDSTSRQFVDIGDKLTAGANIDGDVYEFWKNTYESAGFQF